MLWLLLYQNRHYLLTVIQVILWFSLQVSKSYLFSCSCRSLGLEPAVWKNHGSRHWWTPPPASGSWRRGIRDRERFQQVRKEVLMIACISIVAETRMLNPFYLPPLSLSKELCLASFTFLIPLNCSCVEYACFQCRVK